MKSFRGFLILSFLLHIAVGGAASLAARWRSFAGSEMVIDLTGSFRTRASARINRPPEASPAAADSESEAAAVPEEPEDIEFEETDPCMPFYELTSLPRLANRETLKEKLGRYYPPEARARGMEGVVLLEVVVSSRGRIVEAKILDSNPPLFAEAALKVCSELLFVPAYLKTKTVAVRLKLPIRFELSE